MDKKLPIGIESFEEMVKQDFYYVDKSMFIAELLQNWGKVNLFTRPRRFGKSLNMSMLKAFFEIDGDKTLFSSLRISREKELCEIYMGKFPVIFITLKGVSSSCFEDAKTQLKMLIGAEAERFEFLSESSRLTVNDKEKYQALTRLEKGSYQMTDVVLEHSIYTLSQLLSKHYEEKAIILIDEYDVPLDRAFQAGYYDEMTSMLRNLFGNALKTNEALKFAVLTGCLRISKESIFTGLNNLKTNTITDARYDESFGFTDEDVAELLRFYDLSEYEASMREWYDGYQFGKTSVYCPWDVLNYCDALLCDKEAQPENYWGNTSGNAMVRRFVKMADRQTRGEIEQLIAGKAIVKNINQELTYNELDRSIENLWSVLLATGYLTQRGRTEERKYRLAIPNREIQDLFVSQIQTWFMDTARADTRKLEEFCKAFLKNDAATVERILRDYLWNSISIWDTAVRKGMKENYYHGLLVGILQYESSWEIESNAESGEGYCDISIRTPERIGVVIELKYAEHGNLEKGCEEALCQIKEKQYAASLKRDGMEEVTAYGVAFFKKNCKVVLAPPEI